MIKSLYLLPFLLCLGCNESDSESVSKSDNNLLSSDTSIVISDSIFTSGIEGPAVAANGDLFLVNLNKEGTIAKKAFDSSAFKVFVELPEGSVGNGIRFNSKGDMFIADYPQHNVLKIENGTREVTVFAHDSTMNQPNDLAIMNNGILFASDPNWGEKTGNLWRVDLDGTCVLLEDSMGTTNGVAVSPDNKTLYVNETLQQNVWAYDINSKGEISNKRLFHHFDKEHMDGMRCYKNGDLYIARYGAGVVAILSPDGKLKKEVKLKGKKPTNVAFGGPNGDVVFVTLQSMKWVEMFKATKD